MKYVFYGQSSILSIYTNADISDTVILPNDTFSKILDALLEGIYLLCVSKCVCHLVVFQITSCEHLCKIFRNSDRTRSNAV